MWGFNFVTSAKLTFYFKQKQKRSGRGGGGCQYIQREIKLSHWQRQIARTSLSAILATVASAMSRKVGRVPPSWLPNVWMFSSPQVRTLLNCCFKVMGNRRQRFLKIIFININPPHKFFHFTNNKNYENNFENWHQNSKKFIFFPQIKTRCAIYILFDFYWVVGQSFWILDQSSVFGSVFSV